MMLYTARRAPFHAGVRVLVVSSHECRSWRAPRADAEGEHADGESSN